MLAWFTFVLVPPLIGVGMIYSMQKCRTVRAIAAAQFFGNLLIVVFLLVAFNRLNDIYERVLFYEFLAGCGVSLAVLFVAEKLKRK